MTPPSSIPAGVDRTLKIARLDHAVHDATRFAELAVSACSPTCKEAIALAACELAENVAKYAIAHPDPRAATLCVTIVGRMVRVRVTNAVANPDDAKSVLAIVARIAASHSVADLYRSRLRELFANPKAGRAQLGLIRLAFEGGFKLSATFEAPILEIVAERPCESD